MPLESIATTSIHALLPMETGGVEARRGFRLQDHVAVQWCLRLLQDPNLQAVWCEDQDDLTLVWDCNGYEEVEFVQVKGHELNQLWSVSRLCEREKSDGHSLAGTSILERSLAYDRCSEPCTFRLVTSRPVNLALRPLTHSLNSPARRDCHAEISALIAEIVKKVGEFKSENGNGPDCWVYRTVWDEVHSLESIKNANISKLTKLVEEMGEILFSDQLEALYEKLLTMVLDAALTRWRDDPDAKKLKKVEFAQWFKQQHESTLYPSRAAGNELILDKMTKAQIPADAIDTANHLRRHYRRELLQPKYLNTSDRLSAEEEVRATLQDLRSQLDSNMIADSGIEFHNRCLQQLGQLRNNPPISPMPPLAVLQGFMYSLVGRCLHRFVRPGT